MSVGHGGPAQSVHVRLVRRAREIGVDPNLILTRYGLKRFLYRLSCSPYEEQFVLKGALLLLVWLGETLRPTRDADLLGYGELSDDALTSIFRDVCIVDVEPDGITFLEHTVETHAIREQDAYGGRRITLQARLGAARIGVQIDIGIGDAVVPGPQWLEYPGLLDLPRPRLRGYPREVVVAEKLHAIITLGMRNSRMKDYFDVHALRREGRMGFGQLASAIAATFERRRTGIPSATPSGLSDAFSESTANQARWRASLDRNRLQAPSLHDVVREVRNGLAQPLEEALMKVKT